MTQHYLSAAREAIGEFTQQDDYLLAHGASLMSDSSHEIIHVDTVQRIASAAIAAYAAQQAAHPATGGAEATSDADDALDALGALVAIACEANIGNAKLTGPLVRRITAALASPAVKESADRMAYEGAREDLLDWKRRALEAENLVRKFTREINGPTFMGEPAVKEASQGEAVAWRCFHCDETFTTTEDAREHFGKSEYQRPGCQIDVAEYRRMEDLTRSYREEDTDLHRAIFAAQSAGYEMARRAEEAGYARGLEDAKKHPEELGLTPLATPPTPAPAPAGGSEAVRDVLAERQRQITAEGWTPEHDDGHAVKGGGVALTELARAAKAYIEGSVYNWPWSPYSFKPTTERRNLVKAGALIIAEIERIDRAATPSMPAPATGGKGDAGGGNL